MSDNSVIPATGETYASDDISGVKYFRSKLTWGVNGASVDASATDPLPVAASIAAGIPGGIQGGITGGIAGGLAGGISGAITLPTGAATETSVAAILAAMLVDNAGFTDGTSKVLPGGYIFDEVAGTALTENDVAAARIDSKRTQIFVQEDETTRGQRQTVYASKAAKVAAAVESSVMTAAGAELTPKFAFLNQAASGTAQTVVAAVTSKKIRVLSLSLTVGATATNVTLNSASSAKTCLIACGANGGVIWPHSPVGWFETVSGEALTVTTGAGSTTGIHVVYIEV